MTGRVPILTWHSLDDSGSVISTAPEAFHAQIRLLRQEGYTGLPLRDLVAGWEGRAALPPRPVVLTFDDAFRNVLEAAIPALQEAGFRATIFAVADPARETNEWPGQDGRVPRLPLLDPGALRLIAGLGHEVGAHGLTHRRLDRLSDDEAEEELEGARTRLEDTLGREVVTFAYPFGRATSAVKRRTAAHYLAACTDELRLAAASDDRHALGRLDMYYFREPARLRLIGTRAGGAWTVLRRLARRLRAGR